MHRQRVDIVEVAHAAVQASEHNHGVDLLCEGRLGLVGAQSGAGHVEQAGILDPHGLGCDRVTDAHIHLNVESSRPQVRQDDVRIDVEGLGMADEAHLHGPGETRGHVTMPCR